MCHRPALIRWTVPGSGTRPESAALDCKIYLGVDVPRLSIAVPPLAPFHSSNEHRKPVANRVFHNNGACGVGRDIPYRERVSGVGGYRLCDDCLRLDRLGR